jgi:hypothetical protein
VAVAAFLRVINAIENVRSSNELLDRAVKAAGDSDTKFLMLVERAHSDTDDAVQVLRGGGMHSTAVSHLQAAERLLELAKNASRARLRIRYLNDAKSEQVEARRELTEM